MKTFSKEIDAKNIVFACVVRSEHRIDILNIKSIGKEHISVFITERFIEKTVSFLDSVKNLNRKTISIDDKTYCLQEE